MLQVFGGTAIGETFTHCVLTFSSPHGLGTTDIKNIMSDPSCVFGGVHRSAEVIICCSAQNTPLPTHPVAFSKLKLIIIIYRWLILIAQSTAQGHLRAFGGNVTNRT